MRGGAIKQWGAPSGFVAGGGLDGKSAGLPPAAYRFAEQIERRRRRNLKHNKL
jgi:hypothetical protein